MLNLFPPFSLQGIRVRSVGPDFRSCTVAVRRSLLSRNLHGSTFGGTLFAAADPIYPVLLWQSLLRRNLEVEAWLESASIEYAAPARGTVLMHFEIESTLLDAAEQALLATNRFSHSFNIRGVDEQGTLCVAIESKVYLRRRGKRPGRSSK